MSFIHARTHAHTPAHAHTHTHTRIHIHTHTCRLSSYILRVRDVCPDVDPCSVEVGPTLGLKKSTSLESLQSAVQEANLGCDDDEPGQGMSRARGFNDSFRAAVDRSYESATRAQTNPVARKADWLHFICLICAIIFKAFFEIHTAINK